MKHFQILSLFTIATCIQINFLHSMSVTRKASTKFSPSSTTILRNTASAKKQFLQTKEQLYKKYLNIPSQEEMIKPFHHPFYTKLVEPIYIGHKSDESRNNLYHYFNSSNEALQHYYNLFNTNGHIDFYKDFYNPLLDTLSQKTKLALEPILEQYENAYEKYIKDPSNQKLHRDLTIKSLSIIELMKHIDQDEPKKDTAMNDLDFVRNLHQPTHPEKIFPRRNDAKKEFEFRNAAFKAKDTKVINDHIAHEYL
ncbi:MAG: hypothetical protein NTU89_00650 [Candidatus Dependentiae bacterium]|nr:hypothetical protein [Candidatus Dependentiae bacterium]